jgi:hypothetical protein
LQLQILWSSSYSPFSQSDTVAAVVRKTLGTTMSPVREVALTTQSGSELRAILKLYDRRFGVYLRQVGGKFAPHREVDEIAFQSFVRQGKMSPFLQRLAHDNKTSDIALPASRYRERTPEGHARFEAALW